MDWPLLQSLSEDQVRELLRRARRRKFSKGEVIFHEGDPGDSMHLLVRGRVALRVTTPLGDTATLLILRPGEHFGEMAIVSPAPRNATVVALEMVETLSIHQDLVEELRGEHPAIDRIFLDALIGEVRRLSGLLAEALYVPVERRLWRRILELIDVYRHGDAATVSIPLTQEDIAGLVGATRPTINRALRVAEDEGVVRISRGRITILDREAVARRAR